jgi:hypothetical protein
MKIAWDKNSVAWRLGGISLIMAIFYALYCYSVQHKSVKTIALRVDSRLSAPVAKRYQELLTPDFLQQHAMPLMAKRIAGELQAFAGLSARYLSNHKIVMHLKAKTPLVIINDQYVVTVDGALVAAQEFNSSIVEQLPAIIVRDTKALSEQVVELAKFIAFLPVEIWQDYQIIWHNKTFIELRDYPRESLVPRISLVACYTTLFSSQLLAHISSIKKKLQEQVAIKNKKMAQFWRIDVRMERQLVVTRVQGEGR